MDENARKLVELFVRFKLITREQATSILQVKKLIGIELSNEDLKSMPKTEVVKILQQLVKVQYVEFEDHDINKDTLERVPESLARKHTVMPLNNDGTRMIVAMGDPLNLLAIDDLRLTTGMEIVPVFASTVRINNAILVHYAKHKTIEAEEEYKREQGLVAEVVGEESAEGEAVAVAPIVKMLNSIVEQAVLTRVSDIHIEAFDDHIRIRYRIDGQLRAVMKHDLRLLPALIARLKISSNMNIAEMRRPQDGRFTRIIEGITYDFRVSIIPTMLGEKAVLRVINKNDLLRSKDQIIHAQSDMDKFDAIMRHPHGVLIVTGPTGSGKSTTLYTVVSEKNVEGINILTVEDPVEAVINGTNQVQVNNKANVTFANALRAFLRQDPDIIVVGEIRDSETAEIAIRAAVTGHLVISTLHTNDAPGAVSRLMDMGIDNVLISSALVGVIAQRLVKKICEGCKKEHTLSEQELEFARKLGVDVKKQLYHGEGCKKCNDSGYKGRAAIFEILQITAELRRMINKSATGDDIKAKAIQQGMDTLTKNCVRLVEDGVTTVEELIRISCEIEETGEGDAKKKGEIHA
jgi:type IV pilus assembly protein PilB